MAPSLLETPSDEEPPRTDEEPPRTRRAFEPVVLRSPHRSDERRHSMRTVGAIVASVACIFAVLFLVDSTRRSQHVGRIETLASILCCDGCCMSASQNPVVKRGLDELHDDSVPKEPAWSTVLHFAGQKEIDYTASGHHVAQHMENALNELDDLEDHVQSGMPKYLKESAVQREADLLGHKFTRDLEGSGQKGKMEEEEERAKDAPLKKSSHVLHKADHHLASEKAEPTPAKAHTFKMKTGQRLVDQVVAAAKMESHLKQKDRTTYALAKQSESMLKRNFHDAEEEADHATKKQYSGALLSHSSKASSVPAPSPNHFVPITNQGLSKGASATAGRTDAEDQKDEAIVRQLAEGKTPTLPPAPTSPAGIASAAAPAVAAHAAANAPIAAKTSAEQDGPGGGKTGDAKKGQGEERLDGVLGRIDRLIGGYTGGASQHSSFFKHFDSDLAPLTSDGSTAGSASQLSPGKLRPSASLHASTSSAAHEPTPKADAGAAQLSTGAAQVAGSELREREKREPAQLKARSNAQATSAEDSTESDGADIQLAEVKLGIGAVVGKTALQEETEAAEGERREAEGSLRAALFRKREGVSEEGRDDIVNLRMSA